MMCCINMYVFISIILVLASRCEAEPDPHTIGGIFYKDAEEMKTALEVSAKLNNFSTSVKLVSKRGEILEISKYVCELAEEGVLGIIDGTGGRASENVQALCDMLEIPHVMVQHNDLYCKNWSLLNLFPSPDAYNMVLESLIINKEWRNFTILYVKGQSLLRVNELMHMGNDTYQYVVSVRELTGDDYRDVLIDAKHNGYTNFVVDCPSRNLEQLLLHAQQVGLMADEHSYIIVTPDLFTLDMDRYRYGGVNMTGFRLINLANTDKLYSFTQELGNEMLGEDSLDPEKIKTELLLIHDAVEVFAAALVKMKDLSVETKSLICENYDAWIYGSSLLNFMKTNKFEGITRTLIFDGMGQRTDVTFEILELTSAGNQTIGFWKDKELKMTRPLELDAEIKVETVLRNKTLKILISTTAPYGYIKNSADQLEGNDRYEGFTVDLIEKLSEILGFSYEFGIENSYGKIDKNTGKWDGMVEQLRDEKADLALCDFTMTAERQSGIDFSTPFMTLGIGILYKQPSKQPPEMFSFMAVFSKEVWYYMMLIQFWLGVVLIFVGRISNKEWQNPVPCVEQPEELSNQFSFANSVWLIIGSVMQQGSEIAPIALAPRLITSVWWFFTMVMVASYVGTLVAFLTVEKNVLPFNTVDELAKHKSISYGAKLPGSTEQFFAASTNPTYQMMYKKMTERNWLVNDNDVGVKRAETTTYAFFMESTSIEYYTERHCDLLQIGGLLDSKSYGIGMKKGSPYKRYIDDALLKLKEAGEIDKLKTIWWKEKRGGGKCGESNDEEQKQLGMKNMLGAFVVLGAGCLIGLFLSILDMLWGVFKRSVKYQTTFKYELVEELKFALRFSGSEKPVKRPPKTVDGSAEELAKAEGKDEVRSLKSVRSTDTHRTHRSHGSRHSSRSLSVAFARRREYS
ncbi:glutamate receptor ionotropic, kainate 3-like [Anticarsia gemmatalis]|uniref:glutamate receptor ionotropic, kainate 3-like n=1 Tax=Anticarsia gemmatalis TaxID=129554 RepID=UPI003F776116